jgi:hypothetical protein
MDDLTDMTDEEVFTAMFDGHEDARYPVRGLGRAIRNLAIDRKPAAEWTRAFEEFGARLFAMLPANDARARSGQTLPDRN